MQLGCGACCADVESLHSCKRDGGTAGSEGRPVSGLLKESIDAACLRKALLLSGGEASTDIASIENRDPKLSVAQPAVTPCLLFMAQLQPQWGEELHPQVCASLTLCSWRHCLLSSRGQQSDKSFQSLSQALQALTDPRPAKRQKTRHTDDQKEKKKHKRKHEKRSKDKKEKRKQEEEDEPTVSSGCPDFQLTFYCQDVCVLGLTFS